MLTSYDTSVDFLTNYNRAMTQYRKRLLDASIKLGDSGIPLRVVLGKKERAAFEESVATTKPIDGGGMNKNPVFPFISIDIGYSDDDSRFEILP